MSINYYKQLTKSLTYFIKIFRYFFSEKNDLPSEVNRGKITYTTKTLLNSMKLKVRSERGSNHFERYLDKQNNIMVEDKINTMIGIYAHRI